MLSGNYTHRPQQLGNMQYGASQGYGPGPGGQQNPQTNNMGPGQYQGRPMPNHVPQFPYQVSAMYLWIQFVSSDPDNGGLWLVLTDYCLA